MEETVQSLKKDDGSLIFEEQHRAFSKRGYRGGDSRRLKNGGAQKVDRRVRLWEQSLPKGRRSLKARILRTRAGPYDRGYLLMEGAKSIQLFQDHLLHLGSACLTSRRHGGRAGATADCIFRDGTRCRCCSFGLKEKQRMRRCVRVAPPRENIKALRHFANLRAEFRAAGFKDGQKVKNARMTVWHNGVVIHDHLDLPRERPPHLSRKGRNPFVYLQIMEIGGIETFGLSVYEESSFPNYRLGFAFFPSCGDASPLRKRNRPVKPLWIQARRALQVQPMKFRMRRKL